MTWRLDKKETKVLMHFDGSDESTSFVDESGRTWTSVGGAKQDNGIIKFGICSLYLDGVDDYIYTNDSVDIQLGSIFSIGFYFYSVSLPGVNYRGVIDKWTGSSAGYAFYFPSSSSGAISVILGAGSAINSTTNICNSTYHLVELVGDGTNAKLYIDCNQEGSSVSLSGLNLANSGHNLFIGGDGVSTNVNGNAFRMEEFRIIKDRFCNSGNYVPLVRSYQPLPSIAHIGGH